MQLSRIGPFALEAPIDGTKTSNVLRGVHVERKMSVAIKLLPPSVAKSAMGKSTFAEDIKVLQQLDHPGIVRVFGGAVEQGQPYLVLELIDGESLQERLYRRGRLPWEMAIEIVDGLCEALMHAHELGIVHQRITPDRILLPAEGGVKLTGFDCKWADHDEVIASRSPMRVAHYLSPEQFRGRQSATYPQCDLFSLGVILYECLTGEMPWMVNTTEQLRQARRERSAPRISSKVLDCPVWLDLLSEKLLAKVRSARLQSADEAHRAIFVAKSKSDAGTGAAQQAWSGKKSTLTEGQDQSEIHRLKRRRPKKRDESPFYERAWFLAICLAVLAGVGAWLLWPASEAELYAKARPLMLSDSPVDWKRAQEQYLTTLLDRFPDTSHKPEIQAFTDRYDLHRAEERIKNLSRFAREADSQVEAAFAEACEFERFGDQMTAWQKYEALIQKYADSDDPQALTYVKLAQRHVERIEFGQKSHDEQSELLVEALVQARKLAQEDKQLEARLSLDKLIALFGDDEKLRPWVEQAREQRRQLDASKVK